MPRRPAPCWLVEHAADEAAMEEDVAPFDDATDEVATMEEDAVPFDDAIDKEEQEPMEEPLFTDVLLAIAATANLQMDEEELHVAATVESRSPPRCMTKSIVRPGSSSFAASWKCRSKTSTGRMKPCVCGMPKKGA